jgi:hypothetical protein
LLVVSFVFLQVSEFETQDYWFEDMSPVPHAIVVLFHIRMTQLFKVFDNKIN